MRIIGLMSGTSADGVDTAVVDIKNNKVKLLAFDTFNYSSLLRRNILELDGDCLGGGGHPNRSGTAA